MNAHEGYMALIAQLSEEQCQTFTAALDAKTEADRIAAMEAMTKEDLAAFIQLIEAVLADKARKS